MSIAPFSVKDFNGQFQRTLGKVYLGAASLGEALAIAETIEDGDAQSWHVAWSGLADGLAERAETERDAGRVKSARALFLRATEAYRQSSFFHRTDLDCDELQNAWRRTETCFQAAMDLGPGQTIPLQIPFEGRFLYGYLALPHGAHGRTKTLIAPSGYDSCAEETLILAGFPALERGYAVLVVDGPGQGKTLYDPQTRAFMRPDYETVLRAVLDFAETRPEIDQRRIAAIGCSFAGYLVPRGAAGETRLAAMIADPGQFDMGDALLSRLPEAMAARLDDDGEEAVAMFEALAESRDGALLFRPRMAAHGAATVQAYCRHLRAFNNREAAPRITCPSLICDNELDPISTGQGHRLAEAMTRATVEFLRFTRAEGAGGHCEGMGREIFDERAFAWLDYALERID
jgi:pimeloyl-ACP methyl ester carboxylesterase